MGKKKDALDELYLATAITERLANPALHVTVAAALLEVEPERPSRPALVTPLAVSFARYRIRRCAIGFSPPMPYVGSTRPDASFGP